MAEVDLKEHISNGLNFRRLFLDLLTVSAGVFIAFYWRDLLTEAIDSLMPHGQNLLQKTFIGIGITVSLVVIIYFLSVVNRRIDKHGNKITEIKTA